MCICMYIYSRVPLVALSTERCLHVHLINLMNNRKLLILFSCRIIFITCIRRAGHRINSYKDITEAFNSLKQSTLIYKGTHSKLKDTALYN